MKKVLSLLIIIGLLICVTSCEEYNEEPPYMLFCESIDSRITATPEVNKTDTGYIDDALEGKSLEEVFGFAGNYVYKATRTFHGFKHDFYFLKDNENNTGTKIVQINSEMDRIDRFMIIPPFERYDTSGETVDIDTAQKRVISFINQFYSDCISLDEYTCTEKRPIEEMSTITSFDFEWKKYSNGVQTGRVSALTDLYGNIFEFYFDDQDECEDQIPEYTEEEYLAACKLRLEELYAESGIETTVKNIEIHRSVYGIDLESVYMRDIESYCVECFVRYDLEYPDGTTGSSCTFFYYPYADKNGKSLHKPWWWFL